MASRIPSGAAVGSSGLANGKFRCTGPAGSPVATPTARPARARRARSGASSIRGVGTSKNARTNPPYSRTWSIVWLASVCRRYGGRSAVRTRSGVSACAASTTLGSKFAAAVPEVVTTPAGRPVALPSPSAKNPADRSSRWVWTRSAGCAATARMSGVAREPGVRQISRTPLRASSSTNASAQTVLAFSAVTRRFALPTR